jgi:hypothetical protein
MNLIAVLLAVQVAVFGLAGLVHAGILASGLEHARASTAEGTIAAVVAIALVLWISGAFGIRVRYRVALGAQVLALLGTIVGAVMIAIGVGPQTRLDLAFHVFLLALLAASIFATLRAKPASP